MINLKRAYEEETRTEGYKVLVDRLWPRGIKKENLQYDYWAKDLAPSNELRKWFHQDPEGRWGDFRKKYLSELRHSDAAKEAVRHLVGKKNITLLFGAKDQNHNQAVVLKEFLEKRV